MNLPIGIGRIGLSVAKETSDSTRHSESCERGIALFTNGTLEMLRVAPYGAYAMNMNQRIMFWNRTAEVLTGHRANQVIGRPCYEVLQNRPQEGKTPVCTEGCPSILLARCGRIAPVMNVHMLCASGERKEMTMTPLLLPDGDAGPVMLLHLFQEMTDQARAKKVADGVREVLSPRRHLGGPIDQETTATPDEAATLTARELEVLRLVGLGLSTREIARELVLSGYTVRNHIYHVRTKLGVATTLGAVLAARHWGLL